MAGEKSGKRGENAFMKQIAIRASALTRQFAGVTQLRNLIDYDDFDRDALLSLQHQRLPAPELRPLLTSLPTLTYASGQFQPVEDS